MNKTLVIVMDSGRLKAFRVENNDPVSTPRFVQIEDRQTNVENHLSQQLTDQAGQFGKGARGFAAVNDMASGERHNIDLELRRRAIKGFARMANELMEQEQADEIYFAAGSEINQQAIDSMAPRVRDRIQKNIPANLTHLKTPELLHRFYPQRRESA